MPQVHGNIDGIRKSVLDEMSALYNALIEPTDFIPQQLLTVLCGYSASVNREMALYITRGGEVADVFIGYSDHIDLPDIRLRRSTERLSMIRCIHTHPSVSGELSAVDIAALRSMRFDAMCAVGVAADGHPTSTQCAFLDPSAAHEVQLSPLLNARKLPDDEWLASIEQADVSVSKGIHETVSHRERAVLVGIESEQSLDELEELAKTAGAECVLRVLQKRPKTDTAFFVGRGKAEEIALSAQSVDADLIICDDELSGAVQKNLEEIVRLKVIDRTTLILDIFAARAATAEGKLQVEMAQLRYRSARLLGQGAALSRLAGGIGTRGPGESKLEVNRRRIRERLNDLEKELDRLQKQRALRRQSRKKNGIPVVALVGYTNVGKSTLFNRLTASDVYVQDQLFATLDSVSRPLELPHGAKVLMSDTVGFIRKLPHELIKAFHSTLEEAALADLLLVLCDPWDPQMHEHYQTVLEVLQNLDAAEVPRIAVLNKCDRSKPSPDCLPGAICISALTGDGIEDLLLAVEEQLDMNTKEAKLLIPFSRYGLLTRIHAEGTILSQEHESEGVVVTCRLKEEMIRYFCREGAKLLN